MWSMRLAPLAFLQRATLTVNCLRSRERDTAATRTAMPIRRTGQTAYITRVSSLITTNAGRPQTIRQATALPEGDDRT